MSRLDAGRSERGTAMISTVLVMMLMVSLLLGFVSLIVADQNAGRMNRDQSEAYAAAHSGLEKLTADLGNMFVGGNYSPSAEQIAALSNNPPAIPGFTYEAAVGSQGYTVTPFPTRVGTIQEGSYEGLVGLITPYTINVTAREEDRYSEVSMERTLQAVAVPVFQFGIFSENDLSFFAGPNFNFGGRVHTNQNLYLKQDNNAVLTLSDRVTAVGEVVRSRLSNGRDSHYGTVRMAVAEGCKPPPATDDQPACETLALTDESVNLASSPAAAIPPSELVWVQGPPARWEMQLRPGNTAREPSWDELSRGRLNNWMRNGRTGAKRLELPIVNAEAGTTPIDIIRRPRVGDPTGQGTPFQERFYRLASLRILISDKREDIVGLPGLSVGEPINLAALGSTPGYTGTTPIATAGTFTTTVLNQHYRVTAGRPLITGFIKIDRQDRNGNWQDVTLEILNLGIAGRNLANGQAINVAADTCLGRERDPNAILRFERIADLPSTSSATGSPSVQRRCGQNASGVWTTTALDYIPMALYDSREGSRRESDKPTLPNPLNSSQQIAAPRLGGVMHYVELDVANLQRWFTGAIGTSGAAAIDETGYVVYFSDRRGNRTEQFNVTGAVETAELGYEDFVNRTRVNGAEDNALETAEDVNGDSQRQVYGNARRLQFINAGGTPQDWNWAGHYAVDAAVGGTPTLRTPVWPTEARLNPPMFFRRALKIVNGGLGQLPSNGRQGLTIASENPAYVEGNFNACGTSTAACETNGFDGVDNVPLANHVSAAVIADSVTFLSRTWNDIRSFSAPHDASARQADTTWYRLGVISGKGLSFLRPEVDNPAAPTDFGTDGGAHNFLRYIESWDGEKLNYRGSIVSFFINRQATGTFKCCGLVYRPPSRGYNFEKEFLDPNLLPPRTPMFRTINTLSFRQVLTSGTNP